MTYSIWWSPAARESYLTNIGYLKQKWTVREIKIFVKRTSQAINLIAKNPSLFQYSKESDTYRCVITKQITLYYRIKHNRIELLTFWDNRKDPKTLTF
jgi:plasmid stabilization system protein ParE